MSEIVSKIEWSTFLADAKRIIVDLLDFPSKHALSQCSKLDRVLVSQSTWIFDQIDYMVNRDGRKSMEVQNRYRKDIFMENDKGPGTIHEKAYRLETEVSWTAKSEEVVDGDEDFQDLASQRLNEMLRAQKFTVDCLKMDLLTKPPVLAQKVCVNTVSIAAELRPVDSRLLLQMVDAIEPNVDWLEFRLKFDAAPGLGSLETVKKAKRLVFSSESSVTDDELLHLDAGFISIYSSKTTRKGLISFIHKRFDERKECELDVNAEGIGRIEAAFRCERIPESARTVRVMSTLAEYKLTKPGSDFAFYVVDLERVNVLGVIRKEVAL